VINSGQGANWDRTSNTTFDDVATKPRRVDPTRRCPDPARPGQEVTQDRVMPVIEFLCSE
jgi:hypothetical protein